MLSKRQRDCLEGIARGRTTKMIARDLGVELCTVKRHIELAMKKLGVRTRAHAVYLMAKGQA